MYTNSIRKQLTHAQTVCTRPPFRAWRRGSLVLRLSPPLFYSVHAKGKKIRMRKNAHENTCKRYKYSVHSETIYYSVNGSVEVCQLGRWGTVCDDFFATIDAIVACHQLGFGMPKVSSYYYDVCSRHVQLFLADDGYVNRIRSVGSGPIWMDDVVCDGSEVRIYLTALAAI